MNFNSLFKLRGDLSKTQSLVLGIIGLIVFIALWWILAEAFAVQRPILDNYTTQLPSTLDDDPASQAKLDSILRADSIAYANATEFKKVYPLLPTPPQVVSAFGPLINKDRLFFHTLKSIWLNVQGYLWAILVSIPIGFVIGLYPLFKGLFSKHVDAMRYLPLTALTGMFLLWFGLGDQMKIAFLAFGIIVYLLPVVAQRVKEVDDVYTKTVFTLGATNWQMIKSVYIPSVMAKVMDDIRVLTAISWTYIIIAELLKREDGVGSLIYIKARQGEIAKVFAILIIIVLVGFIQDRIFQYLDKRLIPYKTNNALFPGVKETQYGIYAILIFLFATVLIGSFISLEAISWSTILPILMISGVCIMLYGEWKVYQNKSKHA